MRRRQTFNFNNGKWFYVILGLCFISALTLAGVNMYYSSPAPSDGSYVDLSQLDTKEKESTETEKKETPGRESVLRLRRFPKGRYPISGCPCLPSLSQISLQTQSPVCVKIGAFSKERIKS